MARYEPITVNLFQLKCNSCSEMWGERGVQRIWMNPYLFLLCTADYHSSRWLLHTVQVLFVTIIPKRLLHAIKLLLVPLRWLPHAVQLLVVTHVNNDIKFGGVKTARQDCKANKHSCLSDTMDKHTVATTAMFQPLLA